MDKRVSQMVKRFENIFKSTKSLSSEEYINLMSDLEKLKVIYSTPKHKKDIKLEEVFNMGHFKDYIKGIQKQTNGDIMNFDEYSTHLDIERDLQEHINISKLQLEKSKVRSTMTVNEKRELDRRFNDSLNMLLGNQNVNESSTETIKIVDKEPIKKTDSRYNLNQIKEVLLHYLKDHQTVGQLLKKIQNSNTNLEENLKEVGFIDTHTIQSIMRGLENINHGELIESNNNRHLY
jgi:hypothetical protein